MDLNENIANAVVVLQKTYDSVNKMLAQCKAISEKYGYISKSKRPLRWKSDPNASGWLLNSLILVFQKTSDPDCPSGNGGKEGSLYAVQVFLGGAENPNLPIQAQLTENPDSPAQAQLYVSRFDYANINDWKGESLSPADHWAFYEPTHKVYPAFHFTDREGFAESEPVAEKYSKKYRGLKKAVWKTFPLSEVTADTLGDMVFGTFNELEAMTRAK